MELSDWYNDFYLYGLYGSLTSVEQHFQEKPAEANIDKRIFSSHSVLEHIIYRECLSERDVQVLKFLLANGADPLQKGKRGILTFYAILNHGFEISSEFLSNISDIDTILNPKKEVKALDCYIALGNLSGMQYCLSRGADPNRLHCIGIIESILATQLKVASVKKEFDAMVKLLIEHGANINWQSNDGKTPLHHALMSKLKIAKKLLPILFKYNPDVNLTDADGCTPLNYAISTGKFDMLLIKTLLKYGSDPNHSTNWGSNSLHLLAIESEHATFKASKIAEMLINYGASVNQQDHLGNIPLYYAVQKQSAHLVEKLLQHGADITIRNNIGQDFTDVFSLFSENVSRVMLKHFCILHQDSSSNFSLSNEFISAISTSNELRAMQKECKEELEQMRIHEIKETTLNFFKIITSNMRQIATYVRRRKTASVLTSTRTRRYKHYGEILKSKIIAAKRRRKSEDCLINFMITSTQKLIPIHIFERIANFLSDEDLSKFIRKESL